MQKTIEMTRAGVLPEHPEVVGRGFHQIEFEVKAGALPRPPEWRRCLCWQRGQVCISRYEIGVACSVGEETVGDKYVNVVVALASWINE